MALQKIEGKLVDISISTVTTEGSEVWKKVVCSTDSGLDGTVDTTTVNTKCGVLKARGNVGWSLTGAGMANNTPGVNEITADDMLTLFQDGTLVAVKVAHITDETILYRKGVGTVSSYTEAHSVEDNVSFDFGVEIDGDLELVP